MGGCAIQKPSGVLPSVGNTPTWFFTTREFESMVPYASGMEAGVITFNSYDLCPSEEVLDSIPGCSTCVENDGRAACRNGIAYQKAVVGTASEARLKKIPDAAILTTTTQWVVVSPLTRKFNISWDTKALQDGTYSVYGEVKTCAGDIPSPPLQVQIQNQPVTPTPTSTSFSGGGGGRTPTPTITATPEPTPDEGSDLTDGEVVNLPCHDVTFSVVGAEVGLDVPLQPFERTEEACFDPDTWTLRSGTCKTGDCLAVKTKVTERMVRFVADMSASPAAVLCRLMQGDPQRVTFVWPGQGQPIDMERCYFEDDSSFVGTKEFFEKKLLRAYKAQGLSATSAPGIVEPNADTHCEENVAACLPTLVCPYGKSQVGCYFVPKSAACDTPGEDYNGCKKISTFSSNLFQQGTQILVYDDRTYPSGKNIATDCWARIYVGCTGDPELPLSYGPIRPSSECLEAIRGGIQSKIAECRSMCLTNNETGCSGEGGPCISEYPGYGEMCGACEYNCKRTYGDLP